MASVFVRRGAFLTLGAAFASLDSTFSTGAQSSLGATDGRARRSRPVSKRQAVQSPSGASAKISAPHFRQSLSTLLIMGESFMRSPPCTARNSIIRYARNTRSEEHTSELQSHSDLVCRLL